MIRVTVELLPLGDESRKRTLGVMKIANDGTGTLTSGNYEASIPKLNNQGMWRVAQVFGFPRKRLTAWDLLYRVLKEMVGDRNG